MSDIMDYAKAAAQAENTSPTKVFAYGLKSKYLQKKEVDKLGHSIFHNESIPDNMFPWMLHLPSMRVATSPNISRQTFDYSYCINRLWDKSDPIIMKTRGRMHCRHYKGVGHTVRGCEQLKAAILGCNSEYESLLHFLTV